MTLDHIVATTLDHTVATMALVCIAATMTLHTTPAFIIPLGALLRHIAHDVV
jgi:hypothetical protein